MLEVIQVKDISKYVDENTKLVIDSDGLCFRPASIVDEAFIEVKHVPSGNIKEFKNVTEFKGNVRGEGKIGAGSWLDSTNITRTAKGQKPFPLEDFEVTQKTKQKLGLNVATKNMDMHIAALKDHVGIQDTIMILGAGDCFRHSLLLPEQYKANRSAAPRPTQLNNCRQHMLDNHGAILIKDGIHEADDIVNMYAWKGYVDYLKTGKFSYLVASNDKDQRGCPSLLQDWTKQGDAFNCAKPFLIEDTNKSVGGCELVKGAIKGYGFVNLVYQMLCGDSSDNYDPRSVCGKKKSDKFGDSSVYVDIVKMKTPQELLHYLIDNYKIWYPDGLHFTAWNGVEVNEDIYWWLNQMFASAYMKRSKTDNTTFDTMLTRFGVERY